MKEPEDHKKPAGDLPTEPFVWTAPDGRTVSFQAFQELPLGVFRSIRDADELSAMFTMLDAAIADGEERAVLDEQPLKNLKTVVEDWQAYNGVSLGES